MVGLNKIMVIGNLGTDPEMRYTPTGSPVTNFRLAVTRSYTTKDGEKRQETEWFKVETWNREAESCNQYLEKGRRVFVEGRLKSETWVAQDGQNRFTNVISASRVLFLDRQPVNVAPGDEAYGGDVAYGGNIDASDEGDLPF